MATTGQVRRRKKPNTQEFYRWEIFHEKWQCLTKQDLPISEAEALAEAWCHERGLSTTEDHSNTKISKLVEIYLHANQCKWKKHTYSNKKYLLSTFATQYGNRNPSQINGVQVKDWIEGDGRWTGGGMRAVAQNCKAFFQWFVDRGFLTANPLRTCKFPAGKPRPADCIISPDVHGRLVAEAPEWLKPMLEFMFEVGCRPSEMLTATAAEFKESPPRLEKIDHKTKHKGCERIIRLTPAATDIVRELVAKYPTGLLFRGKLGGAVSVSYLGQCLKATATAAGFTEAETNVLISYGYRHGFAHRLLAINVGEAMVASLLGHTSTRLVSGCYGHIQELAKQAADPFSPQPRP